MQSLTEKQEQVLEAIRRHVMLTGQSPTVREIGHAVNLRSSCSVQKHLDNLEHAGKIRRSSFKYRSIELTDACATAADAYLSVPLLGVVAGGTPLTAHQEVDPEMLSLPSSLLPRVERRAQADACATRNFGTVPLFALTVKGDSMINAGIADGDIIVARRQAAASNGDIVIALVDEQDATVKRYYREGAAVRLQPENPAFKPLITRSCRVLGKVALAIKRF